MRTLPAPVTATPRIRLIPLRMLHALLFNIPKPSGMGPKHRRAPPIKLRQRRLCHLFLKCGELCMILYILHPFLVLFVVLVALAAAVD
jgi:hypothetical protein